MRAIYIYICILLDGICFPFLGTFLIYIYMYIYRPGVCSAHSLVPILPSHLLLLPPLRSLYSPTSSPQSHAAAAAQGAGAQAAGHRGGHARQGRPDGIACGMLWRIEKARVQVKKCIREREKESE